MAERTRFGRIFFSVTGRLSMIDNISSCDKKIGMRDTSIQPGSGGRALGQLDSSTGKYSCLLASSQYRFSMRNSELNVH